MNRPAILAGLLLTLAGLGVFGWKAVGLSVPVRPSAGAQLWRVELQIDVRGAGQRGSVAVSLPSSQLGQLVFDERLGASRLDYRVQSEDGQRTGVFSGRVDGVHELAVGFRADLRDHTVALPFDPASPAPADMVERYGRATTELPAQADEVRTLLDRIRMPGADDPVGRLRAIYAFVTDEVTTATNGTNDPLLTLATREGTDVGKARLLVTLLRSAGIPTRPLLVLELEVGRPPALHPGAEAWVDGMWVPMSPTGGFFATRPRDVLVLARDTFEPVRTTGVTAAGYRIHTLREQLRPDELATVMTPPSPVLERLSLYRLPLSTQQALRSLLLLPLGVLVVTVLRNVVGIPSFGTFMPVLIAFALRGSSLGLGLALVGLVIGIGIAGRLALQRLRLLMVPRLSVLLCCVVLAATGIALAGDTFDETDFTTAVLFPIVILTMLVERFSVTLAEEGFREAMSRSAWSVLIAVSVYPLFRSDLAEHLMFSFPELVLCVMGVLIWLGAYTGYRVSDLIRFRSFARDQADLA